MTATRGSHLKDGQPSALRATVSALCGSLVGIGLARFAYTPLIPALIAADWFSPGQAAYLGAANLAGYLVGALLAVPAARRIEGAHLLRAMMLLATASFFACALPLSFTWFFAWRLAAGIAGGAVMVLAAATVIRQVAPHRRGLVAGASFTGVGLGIALSGTLVPPLLQWGLAQAWLWLGAAALVLTLVAWGGWPHTRRDAAVAAPTAPSPRVANPPLLKALSLEYALIAVGLVPHMVFLVDFIARGLGRGIAAGAGYWVLFGLGAVVSPILVGRLADHIGFKHALRLAYVVQAAAVVLPAVTGQTAWLAVSSIVAGAFVSGIPPLVLGRVHELAPPDAASQRAAWGVCTVAFALGQALGGYGLSYLFAQGGGYALLFGIGVVAALGALAIDLWASTASAISAGRRPPSPEANA